MRPWFAVPSTIMCPSGIVKSIPGFILWASSPCRTSNPQWRSFAVPSWNWGLPGSCSRRGVCRCTLGIHGGSSLGLGADTFTDSWAARALRHPFPLALEMVSLIHDGVLDRYGDLRVGFFEGGCAWVVLLLDRIERDESVYTMPLGKRRSLQDYLSGGQVLVGCEGNDEVLSYVKGKVGIEAFAFASDYPHEVDLVAAKQMIRGAMERPDLTLQEKAAVMGENARRFFRL